MWLLLFRSVHEVIHADEVLGRHGVKREVIPTPKSISSECGVCLKIWCSPEEVGSVLKEEGITSFRSIPWDDLS